MDNDEDDANSPSEEEWRSLGDKDRAKAAARSKSMPATSQGRGHAAGSGVEPVATLMARGASEPPPLPGQLAMQIDQYGSNLGKAAPWPVPLVVLVQARAAEEARGRQPLPARPVVAPRVDPPVSPPVDSSTLLTTGSDYDSEDSLGPPAMNKGGCRDADEEGGEVDDVDDESDRRLQWPVLLETSVPCSRRRKTVQVVPACKSARLQGPASEIPIMQRAQEFTAAKNLDPLGTVPTSPLASEFVVLWDILDEHLATVAHDSGLAFTVEAGTMTETISFIRAKEEAQAALALTAAHGTHKEVDEASLLRDSLAESDGTAQTESLTAAGEVIADLTRAANTAPTPIQGVGSRPGWPPVANGVVLVRYESRGASHRSGTFYPERT
jgi:hypothetical protein